MQGLTSSRSLAFGALLLLLATAGGVSAQTPQVVPGDPGGVGRAQLSDDGRWVVWADTDGTCCGTVTPFVYRSDLQNGTTTGLNLHLTTGDTELEFSGNMFPRINRDATRITVIADDRSDEGGRGRRDLLLVLDETGQELLRVRALDEFGEVTDFVSTAPIDPAGRYVAFSVTAAVINADTADGTRFRYEYPGNLFFPGNVQSIFRVDVETAEIELVYIDESGNEPNEDANLHQIGGNGRYISFTSFATDLPGANGSGCLLYRRDMLSTTNGGSTMVSRDEAGQAVSDVWQCGSVDILRTDMSADGTELVFTETGFATPDGNPRAFLWRQGSGSTELAAVEAEDGLSLSATAAWLAPSRDSFLRLNIGSGDADPITFDARYTDISEDGRVVLFNSDELTPPPGGEGRWWTLTFDPPPPPADETPPTWPSGTLTAAQVGPLGVELSWSAAIDAGSGVKEYVVYREDIEIGRTTTRSLVDQVPTIGSYTYRVEAVDAAFNESTTGPVTQIDVGVFPIVIEVLETITVADSVIPLRTIQIDVVETITVTDQAIPLPVIEIEVLETITVNDDTNLSVPVPGIIVIDIPTPPLGPGDIFTALTGGWKPFSVVTAFLESTPVQVGQETADANGFVLFTITVPPDFPPGQHTLALVGVAPDDSPRRLTAPIIIADPEEVFKSNFELNEAQP